MVTLCTQVLNRNDFLHQTLPTWLSLDFSEIVIFNWYTSDKFPFYGDPRIKLVNLLDDLPYSMAKAKNIAIRASSNDIIFSFDCDIKITDKFPKNEKDIPIEENSFYMGRTEEVNPLNGSMICTKKQFESVNGFCERFDGYGYDDSDFMKRMIRKGYKRRFLPEGLEHIFHSNELRGENFKEKDIFLSTYKNILKASDNSWKMDEPQQRVKVSVQTTSGIEEKII